MSPDVLEQALEAYRADVSRGADRSAETLGRILETQRRRHPLKAALWVAIVTSSAVASAAIHEAPRLRAAFAHPSPSGRVAAVAPAPALAAAVAPTPARALQVTPPAAMADVPQSPLAPARVEGAPGPAHAARRVSASGPRVPSPAAARALDGAQGPNDSPSDPEDALFEEVQRDHRSASTAEDLAGWQRYLATYPEGRFAPEARYRRAEALARLGDENAALSAFLWFTRNPQGSSRREDALRWVRALTAER